MNKKQFTTNKEQVQMQTETIVKYLREYSNVPVTHIGSMLAGMKKHFPDTWMDQSYALIRDNKLNTLNKDVAEVISHVSNSFAINILHQFITEICGNMDFTKESGFNNKQRFNMLRDTILAQKEFIENNFENELSSDIKFLN